MRATMNAILYLLRTGCPWRCLPRDSFPTRSTVYNIFRKFQRGHLGSDLDGAAYGVARMGREASPSEGREIHVLLDSEGLPMRAVVHSAAIQDAMGQDSSSAKYAVASRGSN
jgi:hypothetical protein